jgi:hypothetical protein
MIKSIARFITTASPALSIKLLSGLCVVGSACGVVYSLLSFGRPEFCGREWTPAVFRALTLLALGVSSTAFALGIWIGKGSASSRRWLITLCWMAILALVVVALVSWTAVYEVSIWIVMLIEAYRARVSSTAPEDR